VGTAAGAFGTEKKSLDEALSDIENTRKTNHPLITAVWRARRINRVCGVGSVTPWDYLQLDEEWLDVIEVLDKLDEDEALSQKAKNDFNGRLAKRRAQHPSYGK
jgi:hypothetical protein